MDLANPPLGAAPADDAPASTADTFGIDAFTLDDRMRLFHFAAAEKREEYLWLLRAFDRGRANYQVLLHAASARGLLNQLREEHPGCPEVGDVQSLLDSLNEWRLLDRSYDGTRAASLAEYRNRHYVYQFTQAGYRAYRAVEDVLGATLEDAQLSRLIFPDILADLEALAEANRAGHGDEIYRKLSRLDQVLGDMAQRAARFYLMLGDLARTNDTRPEVFLSHKDALLTHMREFTAELARFTPRLAQAVQDVADTGVDALIARAAAADDRLFRAPGDREADWRQRWSGLTHWFGAGHGRAARDSRSEAERLQNATVTAIANVLALLRRVTEARRGGVSRESQLRHLAQWFASCPDEDAAHGLFQAAFGLGGPRHIAVPHEDPELIPARLSWWDAAPVRLARGLVESGREPRMAGTTARIERNDAQRQRLRADQLKLARERRDAAASLAAEGPYDRVLNEPETKALLSLLDQALTARVPASRRVTATGSAHGVRLTLRPCEGSTSVRTVHGRLHLSGVTLEVS
ncbi:hypothetical protein Acor_09890 [Acrocarpospora corrugata]|uniref:TIGR02677 family protein n=1 Tax=Acrocarpospora corrugata TaxID=35763 RepID=A0A5M3VQK2_9ACTN|nr:TIGR02677 family protein [Acrocarpospora corrugata]GER98925.1 hypothetical protein Acor_09890 [Acrocarpospora corrugata]